MVFVDLFSIDTILKVRLRLNVVVICFLKDGTQLPLTQNKCSNIFICQVLLCYDFLRSFYDAIISMYFQQSVYMIGYLQ